MRPMLSTIPLTPPFHYLPKTMIYPLGLIKYNVAANNRASIRQQARDLSPIVWRGSGKQPQLFWN